MRNSILKFLSILCLFVIVSCHKDEVDQNGTITFTVNGTYSNYWVVLSDQSGNVLDWKAMTNGVKQNFSFKPSKDSVNLTLISKLAANDTRFITTYANIGSGDYSITNSEVASNSGVYTINVSTPYATSFIPQSENMCGDVKYSYSSDGLECEIPLCSANSNLYVWVENNKAFDKPLRYLYLPAINPGETLTFDDYSFSQLKEMKSKTIAFNQPIFGVSTAYGNTIKKNLSFRASRYNLGTNNKSLSIYYPDLLGTLFNDFVFDLNYFYLSNPNISYYISKQSQEPAGSFPELNIGFNLADSIFITPSKVSINSTGNGAHYSVAFMDYSSSSTSSNFYAAWYVYTSFSNQILINLPQFPDDLKNAVDLSFVSKMKSREVTFIKENNLGGYSSFYQYNLSKTGFSPSLNPIDRSEITYQFPRLVYERTVPDRLTKYKSLLKRP